MLKFKNVNFAYDKKRMILNNLSFELKQDKTYALLGHNGAGKTTILRLLLGLLTPNQGEIVINGNSPRKSAYAMSYMPETNGIYEKLTALVK